MCKIGGVPLLSIAVFFLFFFCKNIITKRKSQKGQFKSQEKKKKNKQSSQMKMVSYVKNFRYPYLEQLSDKETVPVMFINFVNHSK